MFAVWDRLRLVRKWEDNRRQLRNSLLLQLTQRVDVNLSAIPVAKLFKGRRLNCKVLFQGATNVFHSLVYVQEPARILVGWNQDLHD